MLHLSRGWWLMGLGLLSLNTFPCCGPNPVPWPEDAQPFATAEFEAILEGRYLSAIVVQNCRSTVLAVIFLDVDQNLADASHCYYSTVTATGPDPKAGVWFAEKRVKLDSKEPPPIFVISSLGSGKMSATRIDEGIMQAEQRRFAAILENRNRRSAESFLRDLRMAISECVNRKSQSSSGQPP